MTTSTSFSPPSLETLQQITCRFIVRVLWYEFASEAALFGSKQYQKVAFYSTRSTNPTPMPPYKALGHMTGVEYDGYVGYYCRF